MAFALAALVAPAAAQNTPSPPGARVYFINLKDGDTVTSPVVIQFGLAGMGVAPANHDGGDAHRNTGHHHLLINTPPLTGEALRSGIPADDNHRHYGGGQTEARIELPPGRHTLQLVLGDWMHVPHNPPVMSERITITVR
ncbi:DUF4399 domain-containing protein [Leptolyngbya sp. 15MV]|nr:DUF4399 domain-containing protein [Leptolyngbya sp. 15MV]